MDENTTSAPAPTRGARRRRLIGLGVLAGGLATVGGAGIASATGTSALPSDEAIVATSGATVSDEMPEGYTREQYDAFWGAGYTWDDALALDELWQGDVTEAKAAAGQMILDGEQVPVAPGSTDGPTGT